MPSANDPKVYVFVRVSPRRAQPARRPRARWISRSESLVGMEQRYPECVTPEILKGSWRIGHRPPARDSRATRHVAWVASFFALLAALVNPAMGQEPQDSTNGASHLVHARWWQFFVTGFASSIVMHEGAHIVAAYAMGARPTFGLNEGRPTIYSGIDANLEPGKQFVFSSA